MKSAERFGYSRANVLPVSLALVLAAASQDVRLDHRGAVGLLLGVGGLRKDTSSAIENTWRGAFTVGVTFAVGFREQEIVIAASTSMTRTEVLVNMSTNERAYGFGIDGILWGGYRVYFGEEWKTFVDLDLAIGVVPGFTAGPRVGIGLMYELSSIAGLYSTLSAQLGLGSAFGQLAIAFRAELAIGVQLRSFLLED